ncbi:sensor histidine kinase [bacterium]|nr:sensor histidine kinase [bacterium]
MEHVLINIIENAIKYTGKGGEVYLECYRKDDGVEVKVSDKGIGMSEEEMGSIFDSFARLQNAERKKIKGTGLGLTIVKDIVTAHNGNISVESRVSEGSTFYVWLPGLIVGAPDKKSEDLTVAVNITK